jgi:LysR family transcriptional regulator, hydrogen peroxide-inducible genes activator
MKAAAFTLRQLQYLIALAETLHFRHAAERCQVSQPSLSLQILELEEALGVKLFERTQRKVLLTEAGHQLVERGKKLLLEAKDFAEAAYRFSDPFSGSLRVGVIPTSGPYLLPKITQTLRTNYPKLRIFWLEEKTTSLVTSVNRGELDAAVMAREADLGELVQITLATEPLLLAVAPQHALAKKKRPLEVKELLGEPLLLLTEDHCLQTQVLSFCARNHPEEIGFRATSVATLVQMVASGLGITLLPELAAEVEAPRNGLVLRRFQDKDIGRTLCLAWRKQSALAPALRQIAETIKDALKTSL